jgi:pimeloyl-ACP methyl ester carboxylesterase
MTGPQPPARVSRFSPSRAWLLLLSACSAPEVGPEPQGLTTEPCHVSRVRAETRCATLDVPEDPSAPGGRSLRLGIVRIPAVRPSPDAEPVYFLPGGPGIAGSEKMVFKLRDLMRAHETRDLIVVDHRGTGRSNELDCETEALPGDLDDAELQTLLTTCLAGLEADVTQYTSANAVRDLEAVREAFGHDRVSVYATSYGSRLAQRWAAAHPERIGAMVLDGASPLDAPVGPDLTRYSARALEALYTDCADDPACAAAFPDGLTGALTLLDSLSEPSTVRYRHAHHGGEQEARIDRDLVARRLSFVLQLTRMSPLIPAAVRDASRGNWTPLLAQGSMLRDLALETTDQAARLSVLCTEDVPRYPAHAADTWLGDAVLDAFRRPCAFWPVGPMPELPTSWEAVTAPVLVLSGEHDPRNPPEHGEAVAAKFPNARHVVVPGFAHGVSSAGCVSDRMLDVWNGVPLDALELDCLDDLSRQPFVLSATGTAP